MDIKSSGTVCFTGHRPKSIFQINPYAEARRKDYQAIVDRIADFVCSMYNKGFIKYISGGAQGFDQLAFWALHKLSLIKKYETKRRRVINLAVIVEKK